MRYTGIQPQYFPRLHYFARILNADLFMVRDDVQFVPKHKYPNGHNGPSYQVHTPIKNPSGGAYMLNVTVRHDGRRPIKITEISYSEQWYQSHLKAIRLYYPKAPNAARLLPELEAIFAHKYTYLGDLNLATILWGLLHLLGEEKVTDDMLSLENVVKKLKSQSEFRLKNIGLGSESEALTNDMLDKNEKIIALCKEVGATEDYCGGTAREAYMDAELFAKNGIKITEQQWVCPEYHQQYMKNGFIANLSIIDLLMNASYKEAVQIIKG